MSQDYLVEPKLCGYFWITKQFKFLYGLAGDVLLPNVLDNGDGKAPTQEAKFGFPQAERCLPNPFPCPLTYPEKKTSSSTDPYGPSLLISAKNASTFHEN